MKWVTSNNMWRRIRRFLLHIVCPQRLPRATFSPPWSRWAPLTRSYSSSFLHQCFLQAYTRSHRCRCNSSQCALHSTYSELKIVVNELSPIEIRFTLQWGVLWNKGTRWNGVGLRVNSHILPPKKLFSMIAATFNVLHSAIHRQWEQKCCHFEHFLNNTWQNSIGHILEAVSRAAPRTAHGSKILEFGHIFICTCPFF